MTADRNNNITKTIKAIRKQLFGFINQRVNSILNAEDILQDIFYQLSGDTDYIKQVTG